MSERIQNMLAQALLRFLTSKAFWGAVAAMLTASGTGVWYAARSYYIVEDLPGQIKAVNLEMIQLRKDHSGLERRIIRLEVRAGLSLLAPDISTASN